MDFVTGYVMVFLWVAIVIGNALLATWEHEPIQHRPLDETNSAARDEVVKIFERCGREIVSIKTLQWNAVYYMFAMDAALIWLGREVLPRTPVWQVGVFVTTLIVGTLAVTFLRQCAWDRFRNQARIRRCRELFRPEAARVWGDTEPDRRTAPMLMLIVVGGTVLTLLVLLHGRVSGT